MQASNLFHTYLWLKQKRWKKKVHIYRQVFQLLFDWTLSIYLFLFLILGFMILRDWIHGTALFTNVFASFSIEWVIVFFLGWTALQAVQSYQDPGVYISSSEYQLGLLPYSLKKVWILGVLEQLLVAAAAALVLFSGLLWLTPLNFFITLYLSISFFIGKTTGILIKWRLFQLSGVKKAGIILLIYFALLILRKLAYDFTFPSEWILWGSWVTVSVIGFLLMFHPFHNADWGKVVSYSDVKVWRMWAVQQMTKTTIKPARRYQFLQKIFQGSRARKPFPYRMTSISTRIWRSYLKEQLDPILKTVGGVYVAGIALSLQGDWGTGLGLAIGIFVLNQMASSIFISHFSQAYMHTIPWEMEGWFQSFRKWYAAAVLLILPLKGWAFFQQGYWLMVSFMVLTSIWMYVDVSLSISARFNHLLNRSWYNGPLNLARTGGFVSLAAGGIFPWISFGVIPLLFILSLKFTRLKGSWITLEKEKGG